MRTLKLCLQRGDLATFAASCIVTSANDSLVGTLQPTYWRFISRHSVDGKLREAAGPELDEACLQIEPIQDSHCRGIRRDITRWTGGVKHGASAPVRCAAGSAVSTPAFGRLRAEHVVHAVAPDSEFGYEGLYTGSEEDARLASVEQHSAALPVEGRHPSWRQFTPPDALLLSAYREAFAEAEARGATSVACPALGAGVKGWKPAVSAALGLEAAVGLVARYDGGRDGGLGPVGGRAADHGDSGRSAGDSGSVRALTFVLGGDPHNPMTARGWRAWVGVARTLLGPPAGLEEEAAFAAAAARGPLEWELDYAGAARWRRWNAFSGLSALPLMRVPELREIARNRRAGVSGTERPLSREQELAAVRRRFTRE